VQKNILLVAGEVSADQHGAALLKALKQLNPNLQFWGIGGNNLAENGMELLFHLERLAFLGVGEVVCHLPFIRRVMKTMEKQARERRPACAILIDYPGFNLSLAARLKKLNIPIVYYISPQLWAWGKHRVKKIKKYVDKMLVLFPFEKTFYAQYGIQAEYVGHPLVDKHFSHLPKQFKEVKAGSEILGVLPGSRRNEIEALLPKMLKTAALLQQQKQIQRTLVLKVPHLPQELYQNILNEVGTQAEIVEEPMYRFLPQLDVALVTSGTATLETAYFAVPMVIVYHVNALTYWLGRMLVKVDHIGLANIVAEEEIAPELIQNDFTPQRAAALLKEMLNPQKNKSVREKMLVVRKKLGEPGASQRAARIIHRFLEQG
jgi:lipid-A-disaccharide synthase